MRRAIAGIIALVGFGLMPYFGSAAQTFPPTGANWTRSVSNPILSATVAWEQTAVQEPVVTYESGTYKMWYRGGWGSEAIGYATSTDGIAWTKYASNPVYGLGGSGEAADMALPEVIKVGATYYLYAIKHPFGIGGTNSLAVATSSDGIAWTTQSASMTLPSGCTLWGNRVVWKEGASWFALVEAYTGSSFWATYLYTSSDGLAWSIGNSGTALTSLQVHSGSSYGGPAFANVNGTLTPKVGSVYELWYHAVAVGAALPSDMYHATSTDKINWTITPASPILTHLGGSSFEYDQVADPSVLQVGTSSYLYYDGDNNATSTAKIGVALYP